MDFHRQRAQPPRMLGARSLESTPGLSPAPRQRHVPIVFLALSLASATFGCSGSRRTGEGDVYVEDPTTLAAVRALHSPPEVVVEVERVAHTRGGGGACHSAACLVLLPVLVVAALLPPEITQHATVTTDGEPSYVATFDADGTFLLGQVREGDTWREVRALALEHLGKRPIVSTRRLRRGPGGEELSSERLPILPQAPLDRAYEAALARTEDPEERGELLVEALTWLGPEADGLVLSRLRQAALHDVERAAATEWICSSERPDDPRRAEVVRLVADHGATDSAFAALHCFDLRAQLPTDVADVVRVLARPYCDGDHPDEALDEIFRRGTLDADIRPWTHPPALQCPGPRGELLRAIWHGPVEADPAIVAQGFRMDPQGERLLRLGPHYQSGSGRPGPGWRRWQLGVAARALAIEPATCPAARCDALAQKLISAEPDELTDPILDALVDHYAALPTVDEGDRRRGDFLRVLERANLDATRSERLQRRLQAHEARVAPRERPAIATARLVLGDTGAAAESVRGAYVEDGVVEGFRAISRFGTAVMIADAWKTFMHCLESELAERVRAAQAGRPVTLCEGSTRRRR